MPRPFVSVIVPHLNDHLRLPLCLERLEAQTYPPDRFEVVVVDNGSAQPIDGIVAGFPHARAALQPDKGCGLARNAGMAASQGEIALFTDSDCRPESRWIEHMVAALEAGADLAGGEIRVFPKDCSAPNDAELFDMVFGFEQKRYVRNMGFPAGASIGVWRTVYDQVGAFLAGNLPEDKEWGRRAVAMGFRLAYVPEAVVWHPARQSWRELTAKMDRQIFHQWNHLKTQPGHRLRWLALILALSVPPVDKAWVLATTSRIHGAGQRWRALRVTLRLRVYRVHRMLQGLADENKMLWDRLSMHGASPAQQDSKGSRQ